MNCVIAIQCRSRRINTSDSVTSDGSRTWKCSRFYAGSCWLVNSILLNCLLDEKLRPLLRQMESDETRRGARQEDVTRREDSAKQSARIMALGEPQMKKFMQTLAEDIDRFDRGV